MKKFFLSLIAAIALPLSIFAQDIEEVLPKAQSGDVKAMVELAELYRNSWDDGSDANAHEPVNDYAGRIWAGLIRGYYMPRLVTELNGLIDGKSVNLRTVENNFVSTTKGTALPPVLELDANGNWVESTPFTDATPDSELIDFLAQLVKDAKEAGQFVVEKNEVQLSTDAESHWYYVHSNNPSYLEYTITVGEKSVTRTTTVPEVIKAGVDQQVAYYMTLPAIDTYGTYDASITITKVNGETLATPTSYNFKQDVYTRLVQRHTVVEEWTGTGCGNCPRGWAGMEYLKEKYSDVCLGIAVHQYNSSDPMYCNRYGGLGLSAAPACKIDRKTQADPYYGVDNTGIHNAVAYYSSIAPAVDVTVSGVFTDDQNKINCTADVEWLTDTGKYTIAYVLTADGLTGKGAWLQQNYYANNNSGAGGTLPEIPEFAEFFAGGAKGKGAVELVYNDVMIGSSWSSSGSNLAKALGTLKHKAGDKVSHSYTCSISVSDACKTAMDYDNLYVTAIILDANNEIVNAARAKVGEASSEGIDSVLAPASTDATYDLNGRRVNASAKGLYIVGGKKVIK